jgi:hypothetical protein
MGYTPASVYGTYGTIFRRSIESFQRLTDRAALDAKPARVSIVRVQSRMSLEQFNRKPHVPGTIQSTIPLHHSVGAASADQWG